MHFVALKSLSAQGPTRARWCKNSVVLCKSMDYNINDAGSYKLHFAYAAYYGSDSLNSETESKTRMDLFI